MIVSGYASISVRLSEPLRLSLDQAAERTNRSRSFIVKEALERHLNAIVDEQRDRVGSRLEHLRALKGSGARLTNPRSSDDIDAQVREFRGDE